MIRTQVRFLLLASLLAVSFTGGIASARVEKTLRYSKTQSYNTALRFLRVNQGYKLIEKDLDSGYLLFEYPSEGRSEPTSGSIEVIERGEEISLVVQLPQMPHHHETMLATALLKKLHEDYGEPPSPPKPKDTAKAKTKAKTKDSPPAPPQDESGGTGTPPGSRTSPPPKQ